MTKTTLAILALLALAACDDETKTNAAPSATAATQATSAPAPSAAPPPTASAQPPAEHHDCPEGSTGEGSFNKPCEAKGNARMMEVVWNGKTDDKGPFFKVVNKSKLVILFGKIVVYFYDKAGKQLQVKDSGGKEHPNQQCSGNIFSGVMNAGEKATIQFSCVDKSHVPDGTAQIEAEMQVVGFADSSQKKVDFYWKNADLTPDTRAKGGVK